MARRLRDRRRLGSRLDSRLCTDAFKEYYEYSERTKNHTTTQSLFARIFMNFVSVSKKKRIFFHFLFTFSRAFLRAFARAYNITFFLRARAHAREKVTRIAIIDRPLSMIVGGRVGALFFIVCFLSVLEIQIERFLYLSSRMWQIE